MVMGQEERKNKARLEKTQAALVTSNAEYQEAIKALEGTTSRWNKEWKQACDVCSINFTQVMILLTPFAEISRLGGGKDRLLKG